MAQQKVLVTGGRGMLGSDLVRLLVDRGHNVASPISSDFDITQTSHLEQVAKNHTYDWVINCAAYTAVDKAESEFAAALAVNGKAPGALAAMCQVKGWRFLHVSTDFVFDGEAGRPYIETDLPNPQSAYGKSKLFGEQMVQAQLPTSVICRTSWLYGANGKSFPKTLIEAWKAGKELMVVDDQFGCPTSTRDLALVIAKMIEGGAEGGIYHTAGPETMTWHQFATQAITLYRDLVLKSDHPVNIAPVPTSGWPTPAKRPRFSALATDKIVAGGYGPCRSVADSLSEFVTALGDGPDSPVLTRP